MMLPIPRKQVGEEMLMSTSHKLTTKGTLLAGFSDHFLYFKLELFSFVLAMSDLVGLFPLCLLPILSTPNSSTILFFKK